jgi:hypothetical protein
VLTLLLTNDNSLVPILGVILLYLLLLLSTLCLLLLVVYFKFLGDLAENYEFIWFDIEGLYETI